MKPFQKSIGIAFYIAAFSMLASCAEAAPPYAKGAGVTPSSSGLFTPACGGGPGMMGGGSGPMMGGGHGMGMGMMAGFDQSARLDAIKPQLAIRADQEAVWNTYVKALGDARTSMQSAHQRGWSRRDTSPEDRQALMTQMRTQRQEAWQTVAAAGQTLLASLDDNQRAKAQQSLPGLGGACSPMMGCGVTARP